MSNYKDSKEGLELEFKVKFRLEERLNDIVKTRRGGTGWRRRMVCVKSFMTFDLTTDLGTKGSFQTFKESPYQE